jgi:hypothetical protein
MKALLICPADRPAVAHLAESRPLAVAPLLGQSVLEYWIETLAARGARRITILATDRPNQVRALVTDGARWGVQLEVVPQSRELSVAEARARYRPANEADWLPEDDVVLMDYLPGQPDKPLFESYASWFAALQAWMPHAVTPARIGAREIHPGVWVGLHAQISASAQLHPPCWIGEHTLVGPGTVVGPNAILDDRVIVEVGARVTESIVGPETFVGEMTSVHQSLAQGPTLVNWESGSCLRVPDAFLLCSLESRSFSLPGSSLVGRAAALAAMLVTAPFAGAVMALSLIRGDSPVQLRLAVRPSPWTRRGPMDTFAYYELSGARNWLRRWPQFWSVVRGDLTWFGNRPLRPTQALGLANDFERLWLAAPAGLVSLADAHGCPEGLGDIACAHASFYAVNSSHKLNWFIFSRALFRAAAAWPLRWTRRKESGVPLPQLVPKQQG